MAPNASISTPPAEAGQSPLREMMARYAQPGRVVWIGVRPARRALMSEVSTSMLSPNGLDGDRARGGKRAVTLIQAEHLPCIAAYMGCKDVAPADLRRNLVVSGLNLIALRGRVVRLGTAVIEVTGPCAPCSRMEETLGHGGYAAVRGHGGVTARVIQPGSVDVGCTVEPLATPVQVGDGT